MPDKNQSLARFFAKSAADYYDYLKSHDKGKEYVHIKSVDYLGKHTYCIHFKTKVASLEFCKKIEAKTPRLSIYLESNCFYNIEPYSAFIKLDNATLAEKLLLAEDAVVVIDYTVLVERIKFFYENNTSPTLPKHSENITFNALDFQDICFSTEQEEAIKATLNEPLTYIWGTAGSGKTKYVLAYSAITLAKQHKRILITAPTNVALENVLFAIIPIAEKWGISHDKIWREGVPSKEFESLYPECCLNNNKRNYLNGLIAKKESIETCINLLESIIKCQSEANIMTQYCKVQKSCNKKIEQKDDLVLRRNLLEARRNTLTNAMRENSNEIERTKQQISRSSKMLSKLFPGKSKKLSADLSQLYEELAEKDKHLRPINEEISELSLEIEAINLKIEDEQRQADEFEKQIIIFAAGRGFYHIERDHNIIISNALAKLDTIKKAEPSVLSSFEIPQIGKTEVILLEKDVHCLKDLLSELEPEITLLTEESYGKKAYIIGRTLDRFAVANDKEFDHIYLDEACYTNVIKAAMLFLCNIPHTSRRTPVTFLGDHMQLPPVAEISEEEIHKQKNLFVWLQSGVYVTSLLKDGLEHAYNIFTSPQNYNLAGSVALYKLTKTHRYGKSLAEILDRHIYRIGFCSALETETEIVIVNVPKKTPNTQRRENMDEAYAIKKLLPSIKTDYVILSPYRNQTKLLKKVLPSADSEKILTVHKSQGQEWDTVIFSVTDTSDMWFTDTVNPVVPGKEILNTAISRAKEKLILVCDADFWIKKDNQLISDLIKTASK